MHRCAALTSGYDIVHVHMRHTWVYLRLACLIFSPSIRLIFHYHYGDIAIDQKTTYRLRGLFKPRFYIGVSRELTRWAIAKLKINETSVFLLENTSVPHYGYSDRYQGDWVMVSNLRSTKNILFAIRMAIKMKRKLVIFGNPDSSLYAKEALKFAENSEYAKVVQNETNVEQYFGNFKLAIHTALSETGPLVLLEYMAHGLPFITSSTGEVVSKIREDLAIFIASTFDEEEWEKSISYLEGEIRSNGEALKQKLQNLFNEKFSPKNYLDQCLKIYQNVLAS